MSSNALRDLSSQVVEHRVGVARLVAQAIAHAVGPTDTALPNLRAQATETPVTEMSCLYVHFEASERFGIIKAFSRAFGMVLNLGVSKLFGCLKLSASKLHHYAIAKLQHTPLRLAGCVRDIKAARGGRAGAARLRVRREARERRPEAHGEQEPLTRAPQNTRKGI